MTTVAQALQSTQDRIAKAARAAGRDPRSVTLVAVSKRQPEGKLREAYAAGQRDFGESYAQEMLEKAAGLRDLDDIRWHFVGHLQSNKAKLIAPLVAMLHTVDKMELAEALVRKMSGRPLRCLIEVNLGREPQKHGVLPELAGHLASQLANLAGVSLEGLMCIPPAGQSGQGFFGELRALRSAIALEIKRPLPDLSMGMSEDFEAAIAEGATLVRVGSAIFGEREK